MFDNGVGILRKYFSIEWSHVTFLANTSWWLHSSRLSQSLYFSQTVVSTMLFWTRSLRIRIYHAAKGFLDHRTFCNIVTLIEQTSTCIAAFRYIHKLQHWLPTIQKSRNMSFSVTNSDMNDKTPMNWHPLPNPCSPFDVRSLSPSQSIPKRYSKSQPFSVRVW